MSGNVRTEKDNIFLNSNNSFKSRIRFINNKYADEINNKEISSALFNQSTLHQSSAIKDNKRKYEINKSNKKSKSMLDTSLDNTSKKNGNNPGLSSNDNDNEDKLTNLVNKSDESGNEIINRHIVSYLNNKIDFNELCSLFPNKNSKALRVIISRLNLSFRNKLDDNSNNTLTKVRGMLFEFLINENIRLETLKSHNNDITKESALNDLALKEDDDKVEGEDEEPKISINDQIILFNKIDIINNKISKCMINEYFIRYHIKLMSLISNNFVTEDDSQGLVSNKNNIHSKNNTAIRKDSKFSDNDIKKLDNDNKESNMLNIQLTENSREHTFKKKLFEGFMEGFIQQEEKNSLVKKTLLKSINLKY